MLTLSAANSFGVPTRAIDALDNLPRRYWAVCRCEVLTVAPEIFLRVIEIDRIGTKSSTVTLFDAPFANASD